MRKLLCIPALGFAHASRLVRLGAALSDKCDVVVALSERFRPLADRLGLKTWIVDLPSVDYKSLIRGEALFADPTTMRRYAETYAKLIERVAPDGVVSSMPMAAVLAIKAAKLPHVTLFDAVNHPNFRDDSPSTKQRREEHLRKLLDAYNAVAAGMGLPEEKSIRHFFVADVNLMPDLPCLFPIEKLSAGFAYIGPMAWKEDDAADLGLPIDPARPLVYVSMGSSGKKEHMLSLAGTLSRSGHQVVITTGNVLAADDLAAFSRPGFFVADFLPGDLVIRASKQTVVICHGGAGTIYQALENEAKGIVCLPAHGQHERVAKRIEELGLGMTAREEDLEDIASMIEGVLADRESPVQATIRAELAIYTGAPRGKELVLGYLEGQNRPI